MLKGFGMAKIVFTLACMVLLARIMYLLLNPSVLSWDATIYIGMARYIESLGVLGLWEGYRPPLLPLLYVPGVMLGIPITFAILLTIAASFGALYMAYRVGEYYRPSAGAWASMTLATATLFTTFSTIPTTEVFGVLGFLVAWYTVFIKRSYFLGGVVTALLFILRFPYGLLLPLFGVAMLVQSWVETTTLGTVYKRELKLAVGAVGVIGVYLVSNFILYGHALVPILEGARVARDVGFLYLENPLFYVTIILAGVPLALFGVVAFFDRTPGLKPVRYILLSIAAVFFAYFTYESHKEARYIIPVVAPVALLAGLGISYIVSLLHSEKARIFFFVSMTALIGGSFVALLFIPIGFMKDPVLENYYKSFRSSPGVTILSSTPAITAFAPVKIIGVYTTMDEYLRMFTEERSHIDRVYLNSCDLVQCQASGNCTVETVELLDTLAPVVNFTTIANHGMCQIVVGEVRK